MSDWDFWWIWYNTIPNDILSAVQSTGCSAHMSVVHPKLLGAKLGPGRGVGF